MFKNTGHGLESSRTGEATSVKRMQSAHGEQQSKRTQSGSSSRRARNRGAAVEADAIGELLNFGEEQSKQTQASGEQQLKRTEMGNLTAVTKQIDAIGEQQLKRTQSGSNERSERSYLKFLVRSSFFF